MLLACGDMWAGLAITASSLAVATERCPTAQGGMLRVARPEEDRLFLMAKAVRRLGRQNATGAQTTLRSRQPQAH